MDSILRQDKPPTTFNGPLEAGIRAVALLGAAFPQTYDLQRLVALDFLLVHTGDVGGPESLHPPTPHRSAELLVRRGLVEDALLLMMTRDLVQRQVAPDGFKYSAGENAVMFLDSLSSRYLRALKNRASWLAATFGHHSDQEFRTVMRRFFDDWVEEFQNIEPSMGGKQ
jgi:hypothetical protein